MTNKSPIRACLVASDIGHYHQPRFTASGRLFGDGFVVLEVGGESSYSEFKSPHLDNLGFHRRTIFSDSRYADIVSGRGVSARELNRTLRTELELAKPDVVILKGYSFLDSLFTLAWAREQRIPVVVMSESHAGDFKRVAWKEWIKRQLLHDASAALVGGRPHARYMHSLGVAPNRIFMGYDVVDNQHYAEGAARARQSADTERARLELPSRFILASARLIPKKNFGTLLRAFARHRETVANDAGTPWDLVILGDGPEMPSLKELREQLGLTNQVHLPGFRGYADLPSYYGLAEAFVHPSEREQWGLVVNEAMASGLPVLVSERCGCAEDLVLEAKTGFQFSPSNADQIADHLTKLWRDDSLRFLMGKNAKRRIMTFSPEAFALGLEKACRRALDAPRWGPRPWQDLVSTAIIQRTIRFPTDENFT